ncbi:MAG: hypothetical protein H6766_02225 [Candidatus Peribacteria bacterium]|nr:MAG: hypothetical protein H6766_02225 [Candidatus Peribacteria bacterium]
MSGGYFFAKQFGRLDFVDKSVDLGLIVVDVIAMEANVDYASVRDGGNR